MPEKPGTGIAKLGAWCAIPASCNSANRSVSWKRALSRGSGASVYVVNQAGELTLRPVTVASFNEDDALITGGVSAGEKVVTLGVQKLEPGLKVRSIEAK